MQILSAVFTNTPSAAAAAEVRRRSGTGGQARAKGYRAWATLVVVQARSQSAPGAVESLRTNLVSCADPNGKTTTWRYCDTSTGTDGKSVKEIHEPFAWRGSHDLHVWRAVHGDDLRCSHAGASGRSWILVQAFQRWALTIPRSRSRSGTSTPKIAPARAATTRTRSPHVLSQRCSRRQIR